MDQDVPFPGKTEDQIQLGEGVGIGKDSQIDHVVFREGVIDPPAVIAEAGGGTGKKKDLFLVCQEAEPVRFVGEGVIVGARPDRGFYGLDPDLLKVPAAGKGIVGHGGQGIVKGQRRERSVFKGIELHLPQGGRKGKRKTGDAFKGPFSDPGDRMAVYKGRKDQVLFLPVKARDQGAASGRKLIFKKGGVRKGLPVGIEVQRRIRSHFRTASQADLSPLSVRAPLPSAQKLRAVLRDQRDAAWFLFFLRIREKALPGSGQGIDPQMGCGISPFQDLLRTFSASFLSQMIADDIRVFLRQDPDGPGIADLRQGQEDLSLRVGFKKSPLIVASRDLPAFRGDDAGGDVRAGGQIEDGLRGRKALSLFQDHPDHTAFF